VFVPGAGSSAPGVCDRERQNARQWRRDIDGTTTSTDDGTT
jgi:hypothetical protein